MDGLREMVIGFIGVGDSSRPISKVQIMDWRHFKFNFQVKAVLSS